MSLPRVFLTISVVLFALIGTLALFKRGSADSRVQVLTPPVERQEVDLALLSSAKEKKVAVVTPSMQTELARDSQALPNTNDCVVIEHDDQPELVASLFAKNSTCPIVETITYKSHAPWKLHRSAWLIDYANYYKTPLSFIYRSLTGDADAKIANVADGQQFNVFRRDVEFRFHAVVCLSNCTMRLYYVLPESRRVVFLKSYSVCLGRKDSSRSSGFLTPTGTFQLGPKVAVFQPRMMGMHKSKQVELIQVFGTHWIPFEKEISDCSSPAKGFGLHGTPIVRNDRTGDLSEDNTSIGHYESDGCIRLSGKDIREIFSIVSTRKTYVEVVQSFQKSKLLSGEI
jgi:hypothetical protein